MCERHSLPICLCFSRGLDSLSGKNKSPVAVSLPLEGVILSLQDLIFYFRPPEEELEHEEKQTKLRSLRNRQNLFQEEVIYMLPAQPHPPSLSISIDFYWLGLLLKYICYAKGNLHCWHHWRLLWPLVGFFKHLILFLRHDTHIKHKLALYQDIYDSLNVFPVGLLGPVPQYPNFHTEAQTLSSNSNLNQSIHLYISVSVPREWSLSCWSVSTAWMCTTLLPTFLSLPGKKLQSHGRKLSTSYMSCWVEESHMLWKHKVHIKCCLNWIK